MTSPEKILKSRLALWAAALLLALPLTAEAGISLAGPAYSFLCRHGLGHARRMAKQLLDDGSGIRRRVHEHHNRYNRFARRVERSMEQEVRKEARREGQPYDRNAKIGLGVRRVGRGAEYYVEGADRTAMGYDGATNRCGEAAGGTNCWTGREER